MNESKENRLRLVLEVLGGIAVLIGLVFLGLELRQNTEAMQAATFQDLVHATSEFNVAIAANAELRSIYLTGWQNPELLDEAQLEAWTMLQSSFWARMQNVYFQYQRGTLADTDWDAYRVTICGSARSPGGNAFWLEDRRLTQPFRDFLASCVD